MHAIIGSLDLGVLGTHPAAVEYDYDPPESGHHPASFWLVSVVVAGVELYPILEQDPYMLLELTNQVCEEVSNDDND